jgi:DNA (cytosine-5)-methyltransferase 1
MAHLGDITKLDGGSIPPADIICFGSPCQSFSVAGPRTSFAGKSGLFFEAIRIIREMRCATNGRYPQIAVFENVPGVLSIDGGRSYKAIVEAFCETEVPPGSPQSRRLCGVGVPASGKWANAGMVRGGGVDFAWVCKNAQHYRVPQRRKRLLAIADFTGRRAAEILFEPESLSGYFAARGLAREGTAPDAQSGAGREDSRSVAAFMAGQAKNARSIAYNETLSPTLKGSPSGLNQTPCVVEPQIARALLARHDSSPCADRGQNVVAFAQNQRDEVRDLNGVAGCLAAEPGMKQQTYVVHPEIAGTLRGSGAGISRIAGNGNEEDLTVSYCLQGNMIGRADKNGPQGKGVNAELCFTLNTTDQHAVAAVDCRNLRENGELSGTLQSKCTGGYSLTYQNPVRAGFVVRRLTPTECERLMAFPDGYTAIGHEGKEMSDSARYQMLGNSIVVNVLAYIMQNIAYKLGKEEQPQ